MCLGLTNTAHPWCLTRTVERFTRAVAASKGESSCVFQRKRASAPVRRCCPPVPTASAGQLGESGAFNPEIPWQNVFSHTFPFPCSPHPEHSRQKRTDRGRQREIAARTKCRSRVCVPVAALFALSLCTCTRRRWGNGHTGRSTKQKATSATLAQHAQILP